MDSIINSIIKIPFGQLIYVTAFIGGMLLGPFWYLFQFEQAIFNKYSLPTLFILCAAMALPTMIIAFTIVVLAAKRFDKDVFNIVLFMGGLMNMGIFYAPAIYTIKGKVDSKTAMEDAAILAIILTTTMVIAMLVFRKSFFTASAMGDINTSEDKGETRDNVSQLDHPHSPSGT